MPQTGANIPQFSTAIDDTGLTKYGEKFLLSEAKSLLKFAHGSVIPNGGFGYLDSTGNVDLAKPREAYVQCRMLQVFGLTHLLGFGDAKKLVTHATDSLNQLFFDEVNGGFFNSIDLQGAPVVDSKLGYDHMFVLLAAMTATAIGDSGAALLRKRGEEAIDKFFWDPIYEMMNNHWDQEFKCLDPYRGINVNMHGVEALTAAYDVTGDRKYLDRALAISKRTINDFARPNGWLLPEHFSASWKIDKEFNADNPADPFRPYGVTPGHLFEWSRLILQIGLYVQDEPGYEWILEGAVGLYAAAKKYGWNADGSPGFIYTMGWDLKPITSSRMHWVAAEAVMAAYVLWKITEDISYLKDYDSWWSYIDRYVIDRESGSWRHELNAKQEVVAGTWSGKPDVYHALNACLLPLLPLIPSFVGAAVQIPTI